MRVDERMELAKLRLDAVRIDADLRLVDHAVIAALEQPRQYVDAVTARALNECSCTRTVRDGFRQFPHPLLRQRASKAVAGDGAFMESDDVRACRSRLAGKLVDHAQIE